MSVGGGEGLIHGCYVLPESAEVRHVMPFSEVVKSDMKYDRDYCDER